jgi:hypothetical protein
VTSAPSIQIVQKKYHIRLEMAGAMAVMITTQLNVGSTEETVMLSIQCIQTAKLNIHTSLEMVGAMVVITIQLNVVLTEETVRNSS